MLCQDRRVTTFAYPSEMVGRRLVSEILLLARAELDGSGQVPLPRVYLTSEVVRDLLVCLPILLELLVELVPARWPGRLLLVLEAALQVEEVAQVPDPDRLDCLL